MLRKLFLAFALLLALASLGQATIIFTDSVVNGSRVEVFIHNGTFTTGLSGFSATPGWLQTVLTPTYAKATGNAIVTSETFNVDFVYPGAPAAPSPAVTLDVFTFNIDSVLLDGHRFTSVTGIDVNGPPSPSSLGLTTYTADVVAQAPEPATFGAVGLVGILLVIVSLTGKRTRPKP